jgi:uncharacterized linocin/CFP29 family protein
MHSDLVELGWTEDQLSKIAAVVAEEAQKGRVAAQVLPLAGPEDTSIIAVPRFQTSATKVGGADRLTVDSDPDLYLTRIAVNVYLRSNEVADPALGAALQMFRRAANIVARVEDALVFYGRGPATPPATGSVLKKPPVIPIVYDFTQDAHTVRGLFDPASPPLDSGFKAGKNNEGLVRGEGVVNAIIKAIEAVEEHGQLGPFACVLGNDLFEAICAPNGNLVLPRDRILPFLQGPLVRSGVVDKSRGAIIALSGAPIEILVASDIQVSFLQTTLEPRWVFRVSERVALRIKEPAAVQEIST